MPHVFDTNSLRVLNNYYPPHFPSFWKLFDEAVEKEEVVSVREVYNEVVKLIKDEWYLDWLKQHKAMFLTPGAEEMQFVAEIFKVNHFQTLVGEKQRLQGLPVADPFVVACARMSNWNCCH